MSEEEAGAGRSVLVVDDAEEVRELIAAALGGGSCTVHQAGNGVEALALLETRPMDVIVLDLYMPVMDGFSFLQRLRSSDKTRSIPVLVCSGKSFEEEVLRCARLGVHEFLVKPFEGSDLRERVERVLEMASAVEEESSAPVQVDPRAPVGVDPASPAEAEPADGS